MKHLILILFFVSGLHFFCPSVLGGIFGFGPAKYGIANSDPLGTPRRLGAVLKSLGFTTKDSHQSKTPRVIEYINQSDEEKHAGLKHRITIRVGEEEYVQAVTVVFAKSPLGLVGNHSSQTEAFVREYWEATGGPNPTFSKTSKGGINLPYGVSVSGTHMESKFVAVDVKGDWMYGDSSPLAVTVLSLK